jgi:glycosyltransferase involved in cell wall biosynthesis
MSKKEVGVIFTFPNSLETWIDSGLIDREFEIYKILRDKYNIDYKFYTYDTGSRFVFEGFDIIPMLKKRARQRSMLWQSLWFAFTCTSESKCTHVKSNQLWGSWIALILSWRFRSQFILRSGYEYFSFKVRQTQNLFTFVHYIICFFLYQFSDKIILPTRNDADYVKRYFLVNEQKMTILPNWIDHHVFFPSHVGRKKAFDVLWIGRDNQQKDLRFLVELLKTLGDREIRVAIVSDMSEERHAEIRDQLDHHNLKVTYFKNISNHKVADLMRKSKVFLSTARYEGNPKVILEAMFIKLLVVCRDKPGIRNLIKDHDTGCVMHETDMMYNKKLMFNCIFDTRSYEPVIDKAFGKAWSENNLSRIVEAEFQLYD